MPDAAPSTDCSRNCKMDLRLVFTWISAFSLGLSIGKFARRWLSIKGRGNKDALHGVVSESSRLIAAWRAVETLQRDSLFSDPFALALAGPRAFQQALRTAQAFEGGGGEAPWRRTHRISNVAARVWWFDRQILAALNTSTPPAAPDGAAPATGPSPAAAVAAAAAASGIQAPARNVVVLGAGMDMRPWRLDLPPGTHWFEIDKEDVLGAKGRVLQQLGVALGKEQQAQHPLRAESWAALSADLCSPGWSKQLVAAGFDPARPTVWVAEGLLMYMTQGEVEALLREMAEVSAPGSTLVVHSVTEELLGLIRAGDVDYPPFSLDLMRTWHSGFATDPSQMLQEAGGWQLAQAVSRAQIAAEICGGQAEGKCDFAVTVGQGRDRFSLFVVARKT